MLLSINRILIYMAACTFVGLSLGCSLDVSLSDVSSQGADVARFVPLNGGLSAQSAELVTTSTARGASVDGYVLNGVFLENAENQTTGVGTGGTPGYSFESTVQ